MKTPAIDSSILSDSADLNNPSLFVGREISLIEFQKRVLQEAQDDSNPLLERIKFLSIFSSNMSEFFMVRVAGLKNQIDAGVLELSLDGLAPLEQLSVIRSKVLALMKEARICFQDLTSQLDRVGIHLLDYQALGEEQKSIVKKYFEEMVFPVLTPLAFDPGRPFPHISNLSLNLAIVVRDQSGQHRFARVKVPDTLNRFVPASENASTREIYLAWLEQIIAANICSLFPGMTVIESHPFRITRDAEVIIQELEAADLLESIEESVLNRRFGSVVRMTISTSMPAHIQDLLAENLEIDRDDIYILNPPLGMSDIGKLYAIERSDLKDSSFTPCIPQVLDSQEGDIFAAIRQKDILLHHPYDSFTPVIDFIKAAARDPEVLAIKQTLYRVGKNSPIVESLMEAARNGKQVAVLVELKARFDEESNIEWARALENEGVHVIYGLLGLKTHSKIALVVRKEDDRIRRYVHLATGNYNPITALIYTDFGLFSCDRDMGRDATDLFNYLTGYSAKQDYRKFLVAPINLRSGIEGLILREIEHQRNRKNGRLIFKINSLVDKSMIQLLYKASQAGVQIDLIVRGICCLKPGIKGVSDNIRVISIVGRFLEHSRAYYFHNGGKEQIYLGSADLMPRNLDRRIEILFPVEDQSLVKHLKDEILSAYLLDTAKARNMQPDGSYQRAQPQEGASPLNSQEWFLRRR
jgi:polyphosphate kinase